MVWHIRATVHVCAGNERIGSSLFTAGRPLVREINVLNGVTIAGNPLFLVCPTPVLPEDGLE